ncbi:MAG: hypothetical protein KBD78_00665 [Oligoflexales bacterium]|nr:hypothetical protein [Oligoflexales bacterium]
MTKIASALMQTFKAAPLYFHFLKYCIALCLFSSCSSSPKAHLEVKADSSGYYDIYSIKGENPQKLEALYRPLVNSVQPLPAGRYLILMDCSSTEISLKPNETRTLFAHTLKLIRPKGIPKSFFADVQCDRSQVFGFKQRILNQNSLSMLNSSNELLIGYKAFSQKKIKESFAAEKISTSKVKLGALRVLANAETKERFFVSSIDSISAATHSQKIGDWLLLLPGKYLLELNGSRMPIVIASGQKLTIQAGLFLAKSPKDVDISRIELITGDPAKIAGENEQLLQINKPEFLLPGDFKFRVDKGLDFESIKVDSNQTVEFDLAAIKVNRNCVEFDFSCLGKTAIYLFEEAEIYPSIKTVSDIPVLFSKGKNYELSLDADGSIRYSLDARESFKEFGLGKVLLAPKHRHIPHMRTDFMRVEPLGAKGSGHSHDLNILNSSQFSLIEGRYQLIVYHAWGAKFSESKREILNFEILPGQETSLEIPIYLSARDYAALKSTHSAVQ